MLSRKILVYNVKKGIFLIFKVLFKDLPLLDCH